MPNKGYRQTIAHRRKLSKAHNGRLHSEKHRSRIAKALKAHHEKIRLILARKQTHRPPKLQPEPTPVPPSASQPRSDHLERWALYAANEDGQYYYKQEQADALGELQRVAYELELKPPLFTLVQSYKPGENAFMPIRIPFSAIKTFGPRFSKFKFVKPKPQERRHGDRRSIGRRESDVSDS